jgi:8-oxo-dGTP pyrophosphatase MutT (NUDIX family)
VLLLREHPSENGSQIQVLMTRRHADLKFMGGMWVFPGGVLSDADGSDAALAALPEGRHSPACERLQTPQGVRLSRRECLAMTIAACRETFEETGVLLVRKQDGSACDLATIARLQSERRPVATGALPFADMLEREGLQLDIARLIYWAHWITPSGGARRFDTRFFAIAAPPGQGAAPDLSEASELAWMSPAALLEKARDGTMPIARPTVFNLEDLAAAIRTHATLDALFAGEAERTVLPIMPKLVADQTAPVLLMPWDASYDAAPGEGVSLFGKCPDAFRSLPSRTTRD